VEAEWWGAGNPPPWHGCLSPACGPAGAAAACSGRVQIRFAFLVPAHVGSPGQGGVKRVCVCVCACACACVRVCVCVYFTAVNDSSSLFLEVA